MPSFEADRTEITAFEIEDTYLFAHYFDQEACFEALAEYYIDLRIVDDPDPYCVVVGPDDDASYGDVLRNSVLHVDRGEHTVFLMKDELSKRQAIEWGATPLDDADVVTGI